MTKPSPTFGHPHRPRRWLWVVLSLGGTLLIAVGSVLLHHAWRCHVAGQEVQAAEAKLDATDPGWRFDDVIAARRPVPPGENSAEHVLAAARLLPRHYRGQPQVEPTQEAGGMTFSSLSTAFEEWPPNVRFDALMVENLCRELVLADGALREAHRLADRPAGRYDVEWRVDFLSTLIPHVEQVRWVIRLLTFDAGFRANDGDMEGAMASLRATLNAGRSLGDEPMLISTLVRVAAATITVLQAERVLAQGEPSDAELSQLQQLLEREERETVADLLYALKGERALTHRMIDAFDKGQLTFEEVSGERRIANPSLRDRFTGVMVVPMMRHSLAVYLERLTTMIEAAGAPMPEWDERVNAVEALPADKSAVLANLLMPAVGKVFEATRRKQAVVRCAATALAAERFRKEKGRWPERLEELAPAFVKEVPADPYDGAPLRMKRTEDGLLIYSVGQDGTDNGGEIDRKQPTRPGADLGFRLWNVDRRGLPPDN